jgi:hypothetical protein
MGDLTVLESTAAFHEVRWWEAVASILDRSQTSGPTIGDCNKRRY